MIALLPALSSASNPPIDWHQSQPGVTALIVVGALFAGVALLWRSFLKHVKKAKEPWEGDEDA